MICKRRYEFAIAGDRSDMIMGRIETRCGGA